MAMHAPSPAWSMIGQGQAASSLSSHPLPKYTMKQLPETANLIEIPKE